jgi:hypothetical protein
MLKYLFRVVAATGVAFVPVAMIGVPAASADTVPAASSANWAGDVASAPNGGSGFSRVSGSWIQPSADPSAGDGDSAFWVGLGGDGQSGALEQVGTQADVTNGQTAYYAWYELVPSAPVKLDLAIKPGDHISSSVAVSGTNVTVSLSDLNSGQSYTNTLQMSSPDTSSAEWIAEAPSSVDGQGDATPLPLADFGTVNFSGAAATADGHTGTISDPSWTSQPVALSESSSATAQPSSLSSDGASFSVAWQAGSDPGLSAGYGGDGGGGGDGGYGGDTMSGYGGYGGYDGYGYPADGY